jgi:hypothetical protein
VSTESVRGIASAGRAAGTESAAEVFEVEDDDTEAPDAGEVSVGVEVSGAAAGDAGT